MNRWRRRLDELRSEARQLSCTLLHTVQNVQNVQKPPMAASFEDSEHSEHSEQQTESVAAEPASWPEAEDERAAPTGATMIAPVQWLAGGATADEPPYDEPCPARRGVFRRPQGRFEHFCAVCGAWGAFGYGVTTKEPGVWYCLRHRPVDDGPT